MKVSLIVYYSEVKINTPMPKSIIKAEGVFPNLGISYIASFLKKNGHKVEIVDAPAYGYNLKDIKDLITKSKPDIVGVTCMTPNLYGFLDVTKTVKEVSKNIITLLGGPHVYLFPKETLIFPYVDFGIIGEGEYTIIELLKAIESGSNDFSYIEGLVWKKKNEIILNKQRGPIKNLDDLPFPARHLLPIEKYGVISMKHPVTTMVASRGCPYLCSYCFKENHFQKFRIRSAKNIVDEMEECIKEYRIKHISFYDDCWANKALLTEVCQEILRRNLKVTWETPHRVNLVDEGSLKLMKAAGCTRLRYGIESGSPRILEMMNRNTSIEQIKFALKKTKEMGIETFAYFMIGYPTQSLEEEEMTIRLAKELKVDWAMFSLTIPMPGTKLWEQAVRDFNYDSNYWGEWVSIKRTDGVRYFVNDGAQRMQRAYRAIYFRSYFIIKRLFNIETWEHFGICWNAFLSILKFKMHDNVN